jgi:hypothetical protein
MNVRIDAARHYHLMAGVDDPPGFQRLQAAGRPIAAILPPIRRYPQAGTSRQDRGATGYDQIERAGLQP